MLAKIRDRIIRLRLQRDEKEAKIGFFIVGLVLLVLLANVVYLNLSLFKNQPATTASTPEQKIATTLKDEPAQEITTPTLTTPSSTPIITSTPIQNQTTTTKIKDYYVNLGSGSNKSSDWTDVAGTLTTIDLGQYEGIEEVHFEATINVPTANGTVSVRLYNVSDKHPVWNSEITRVGTADDYLFISPSLIYDTGPKLYQVQMRTQLNVSANLSQARLRIVAR